jgi:putative DNA primase/helicase
MSDTKDVASKAADNVARLAALFHLFEQRGGSEIQVEFVKSAIVIVTWHLYEAKRFLYEIAMPEHLNNAIKLDEYILRYCRDNKSLTIAKNHLRQNGPVRDKKLHNDGLDELFEANRIRVILDSRTSIVEVNPALLGGDYA